MPRASLSADEIATFRKRAIATATKLFAEQGYEAVTMRAIADKLGTSAMAPYRYFQNKAEIFALVRAEATRVLNDHQAVELYGAGPIIERLVRARDAYVRFALEHPDQYRIIFEQPEQPHETYPELVAANQRSIELMQEIGRLAVESGLFAGDPTNIAHLMWAQVHGLISLHHAGKLTLGRTLDQVLQQSGARLLELSNATSARAATPKRKRTHKRKRA